ncbi:hypothetical protein [Sphingobacterium sp.]|uniref:hypothetical protein n=1 Tax=Sphingobacterium sp. TaxID=341027 RepID=UPI0031D2ECA1
MDILVFFLAITAGTWSVYGHFQRKKIVRIAMDEYISFDLEQQKLELLAHQVLTRSLGNFEHRKHWFKDYWSFRDVNGRFLTKVYIDLEVKNRFNEICTITAKINYGVLDGINGIEYEPALD